ncbi:MAG: hypothetical protein HKN33_06235 [Pyrinomonadaceae bacterium]|nr:hypothetical protein [Pyrinomonadaceae bacterium]
MKWLVVLLILAAVIAYVIYRYRKHLQTAWFMYRTFRQMRKRTQAARQKQVPERDTSQATELTPCPKCGKWTAKEDGVKLKGDYFCSLTCLEETMAEKAG